MDWANVSNESIDSRIMVLKSKKLEKFCQVKNTLVIIKKKLMYQDSKLLCSNLGGQMLMDPDEWTSLPQRERFKIGIAKTCTDGIWIPAIQGSSISPGKYKWLDDRLHANKTILNISNWSKNEPNGLDREQCVVGGGNLKWYDVPCHWSRCSICYMPLAQTFYLRGPEIFEHEYWLSLPLHWNETKVVFEGRRNRIIWYPLIDKTIVGNSSTQLVFNQQPFGILKSGKNLANIVDRNEWIFTKVRQS